jgi:uncharacterized Zn finger protein
MAKRKKKPSRDAYDFDYGYFPPSQPIRVEGGLQSRSQRGAFAANWWAKRWLAVLESYGIGSRLQRGRTYARSGQVLNIDIQSGLVQARVQGSRPKPYSVEIQVATLQDTEWASVLDTISQQAIFAAQLLDGTMPQEIETAFEKTGISLFPAKTQDIHTNCSCPDYSNPCKHIAAVYYLLGEQFDRDPFLIFMLRGRTRDQVMEALRSRRAAVSGAMSASDEPIATDPASPSLNDQIEGFWGNDTFDWVSAALASPVVDGAVLRRLGPPPGNLKQPLETLYRAISSHARVKILGNEEES